MSGRPPTVAFCGYSRAGKDFAGEALSRLSPLRYRGSLSWIGKALVAEKLGICEQTAWETRHQRRREWYEILNAFRREPDPDGQVNPARLIKLSLSQAEIVVGIRDSLELRAARAQGLLDHILWIERPGTEIDPTVTYSSADCDQVLVNDGTEKFVEIIRSWAYQAGIPGRAG